MIAQGTNPNEVYVGFVGPGGIPYDDQVRLQEQMQRQIDQRAEEEMAALIEKLIAFCCYSVCLIIMIAIPYESCDDHGRASEYSFNYKTWSIVFLVICMIHLFKEFCFDIFNQLHMQDVITLRTRNRLRQWLAIGFELMHIFWQIYGNFIYWEWRGKTDTSNELFEKCMDFKNPHLEIEMFILLLVGYFFLLIYILAICFICHFLITNGVFDRDYEE